VLLPLLLLPPPCCPGVASGVLPPLPEGEISRDPAAALLALPRLLVVAGVTLGHVFSSKPDRAILKKFRAPIVTNLPPITSEHNRSLKNKWRERWTEMNATVVDRFWMMFAYQGIVAVQWHRRNNAVHWPDHLINNSRNTELYIYVQYVCDNRISLNNKWCCWPVQMFPLISTQN
jgi:hypothetical protein